MYMCHVFCLSFLGFIALSSCRQEKSDINENEADPERRSHKKILRIKNEYGRGVEDKGTVRIYGGAVSDTKNYPYMAAIIINGRLWCAGVIVDENWVVTAAHCLN